MKKNFLFKWVSILGAVMLLTNTMLPGLQAYADEPEPSAWWNVYALHALPANNWTINENSAENGVSGTYTSADGTYTVAIDEDAKTITYSDISLKDPSAGTEWTASAGRPAWYVWLGARFVNWWAATQTVKIGESTMEDWYVWVWINADKVKELVNAGTLTKEWTVNLNYDNVADQYKIIIDLENIEIFDTDGTTSKIKVEDWVITSVNGQSTSWSVYALHALPANNWTINENSAENGVSGTYTSADGTYTVAIDEDAKTITYSDISLKDPSAGTEWTASAGRPAWYVWLGARFIHPKTITNEATFRGEKVSSSDVSNGFNDQRVWISASKIQELVNAGTLTKEWVIPVSWNGSDTAKVEYKMIINLKNIEVKDTDEKENETLVKVVNWTITELNLENTHTITFVTDWGTSISPIKAVEWTAITTPENPTKAGYTFAGWDKTIPTTMPAEDMTITAKWNKNSSGGSSSWGGGGSSRTSTTKTTTTTTWDAKTTTDTKATDTKTTTTVNTNDNTKTPAYNDKYSKEFNDAYQFAYKNGITTMPSIEEADMESPLTRIAMAKMLSQYAINVLGKTPDTTKVVPAFPDVTVQMDADYNNGVTLAYQLWIMWIGIDKFRPDDLVTRAEFATALSRLLFNTPDGEWAYYETHLAKLMEEKIITNNNPDLQELRGYVMIMLMRSAQS